MKLGRNDLCSCNSGKKYKKCCLRTVFPERNIITLDTCICRYLMNDAESPWYADFCEMSKKGIHFCIADVCAVELLKQFLSGKITVSDWVIIITKLRDFISSDFPILPGKKQLFQLAGTHDIENENDFDWGFEKKYSNTLFRLMSNITNSPETLPSEYFDYNGQKYQCSLPDINNFESALEDERNTWICNITQIASTIAKPLEENLIQEIKKDQDTVFENIIPISQRMDLLIRYMVHIIYMSRQGKTPYNPESLKNKNDGIDFVALFSIILPSRFCTIDHVKQRLSQLKSFQSEWIVTPENVVDLYKSQKLYRLQWFS